MPLRVSCRFIQIVVDPGTEGEIAAGDAASINPNQGVWIVGDESVAFSP
jgi:hypothetical protein